MNNKLKGAENVNTVENGNFKTNEPWDTPSPQSLILATLNSVDE